MYQTSFDLSYDEMKRIILGIIQTEEFNQYHNIEVSVSKKLKTINSIQDTNRHDVNFGRNYDDLNERDSSLVREIVWDLIFEGVLTIGFNKANDKWPFISVSRKGRKLLNDDISIYDVDGIISYFSSQITNIDPIIISYISECLHTYKKGAYMSSCVMLGCATEKAILLLIESYIEWIRREFPNEVKKFDNSKNKMISRRFDEFVKSIKAHKNDITNPIADDFEVIINSVFTVIRKNRNNMGHPTGQSIDRFELSAWIHVFRVHCKKIYELIAYFDNN